jgi:integrase
VDKLKVRSESKRRPFTAAELRRVLQACGDTEWRGMVLFGIYTGARLGDIARLTWRAADLQTKEIAFTTGKTGRRMILPLAKPLRDYLESLPSTENPDAPIFPQAAASAKWTGTLSNGFYEVIVSAGLAEPRTKQSTGRGRNASRPVGELSFHSLRHSATTFLKAAGVSDALAREIIGHDSAAISRGYTHLSTEDLRAAMDKLPDITKAAK